MSKNLMLVGEILSRVSALGDTELAGMVGQLLSELSAEPSAETTSAPSPAAPKTKYVVCVEATTKSGEKLQHPIIGGGYGVPSSVEGYTMTYSDDLVALQRQTQSMAQAIESRYGVNVRYVPVTEEALESLKTKLRELIQNLSDMVDKAAEAKAAAYGTMNVSLEMSDISDDMLRDVISKTLYAGSSLNTAGEVVDRVEGETYVEEDRIAERAGSPSEYEDDDDDWDEDDWDEDDEDEDDEDEEDDCDGDCSSCENPC